MSDYFEALKVGALLVIAVGGLIVAYRCAVLIYRLTVCKTLPPSAAVLPVPDAHVTEIGEGIRLERRVERKRA